MLQLVILLFYRDGETVDSITYLTFAIRQDYTMIAYTIFDFYVDLFLLWLLFRFMTPRDAQEKSIKISAQMFAHNVNTAG